MNYIMCTGGLGNQMFQYAFYYACRRKGRNVELDTSFFNRNKGHYGFELNKCFGIEDYVNHRENNSIFNDWLFKAADKCGMKRLLNIEIEQKDHYITDVKGNNRLLYGYWQSPSYFYEYRDELAELFQFKGVSKRNQELSRKMGNEDSVAIHVRRGDYLSAPIYYDLSLTGYYTNCLNRLAEYGLEYVYYVFSDDPEWCRNSGLFPEQAIYVTWNSGSNSYEDMYLMSSCRYCIVANSTFSWWSGYLGNHKIVMRPSKYKSDWDSRQINAFFPADWKRVETDRTNEPA